MEIPIFYNSEREQHRDTLKSKTEWKLLGRIVMSTATPSAQQCGSIGRVNLFQIDQTLVATLPAVR